MQLVIAEKPSVAQLLARVIGADKRQEGYLAVRRAWHSDTCQELLLTIPKTASFTTATGLNRISLLISSAEDAE